MAVSRRTESPAIRQRRLRRLPRAGRPYVADLASCWRSGSGPLASSFLDTRFWPRSVLYATIFKKWKRW